MRSKRDSGTAGQRDTVNIRGPKLKISFWPPFVFLADPLTR